MDHCEARVEPVDPDGPLGGLTFAVKDNLDVAGYATGCGQPTWLETHRGVATTHAPPVADMLKAGATLVGKTQMDELAWALQGENVHYGTPVNPAAPGRIPGGSSSGSAVAVAAGYADVALGTDTAGSVRVPAAYCGLCGFRPTHGRLDLTVGCVPLAPTFDTVGWFARDAAALARVGSALLPAWGGWETSFVIERDALLAADAFALCDGDTERTLREAVAKAVGDEGGVKEVRLGADGDDGATDGGGVPPLTEGWDIFRVIQTHEVWANLGEWVTANDPAFGPGVRDRFAGAAAVSDEEAAAAAEKREAIARRLEALLTDDEDDAASDRFLFIPSVPAPPLEAGADPAAVERFRTAQLRLTTAAGLARLPQVTVPVPGAVKRHGAPLGISVVGPRGTDEALLELACQLERALRDAHA